MLQAHRISFYMFLALFGPHIALIKPGWADSKIQHVSWHDDSFPPEQLWPCVRHGCWSLPPLGRTYNHIRDGHSGEFTIVHVAVAGGHLWCRHWPWWHPLPTGRSVPRRIQPLHSLLRRRSAMRGGWLNDQSAAQLILWRCRTLSLSRWRDVSWCYAPYWRGWTDGHCKYCGSLSESWSCSWTTMLWNLNLLNLKTVTGYG